MPLEIVSATTTTTTTTVFSFATYYFLLKPLYYSLSLSASVSFVYLSCCCINKLLLLQTVQNRVLIMCLMLKSDKKTR